MVGIVNILIIFFFNMFHCATLQKKFCQDRVLTIHVYEIVIISSCLNSKYKKGKKGVQRVKIVTMIHVIKIKIPKCKIKVQKEYRICLIQLISSLNI